MLQSNKPIGRLGEALLSGNSVVVAELAFARVIEARISARLAAPMPAFWG